MRSSDTHVPSQPAVLVIGDPGSGKTRIAASFPGLGILDCDGNLASAVRVLGGKKFNYSYGFKDDNNKEIPEEKRWEHCCQESAKLIAHAETTTFVLDGLSNLCRWGLVFAENKLKAAGIDTRKEYLAKYQQFIPLLTNYLTTIRLPGKTIVVTVHQFIEKAELEGKIVYRLDIPGRLADTFAGQFTDAWGAQVLSDPGTKVGAKYFIKTKPSGYHVSLKTAWDLDPSIEITGKTPEEVRLILAPKLSINQPKVTLPNASPIVK